MTSASDIQIPQRPSIDAVEVTMPETGSDEVAIVVRWLKQPHAPVGLDEAICLVAWEEITAEVGSPASGVLREVVLGTGDRVPIGASLAVLDLPGGGRSTSPPAVETSPNGNTIARSDSREPSARTDPDIGSAGGTPSSHRP